ncbi:MAG: peptidoglycan DD-metalloendopeptidase family protein [Patescibacteria group bacterium]
MKHWSAFRMLSSYCTGRNLFAILLLSITFSGFFLVPHIVFGETAEEIQQKIADQNAKIAALEKEIATYESTLSQIGGQKATLQGEINRIDISRKKIAANISVTQNKITSANLQLKRLGGAIDDKSKRITDSSKAIEKSIRTLYELGNTTLVEHILSADGIMQAWQDIDQIEQFNSALKTEIVDLQNTKQSLTVDYNATQKEKAILLSLKNQLSDQKVLLDQNRNEQATLLAQTKNKESTYQQLLAQKQQAKLEFEKQLGDYEASLKYTLDTSAIPKAGSGVLSFPLDPSFMSRCKDRTSTFKNIYCITQYFGNTAFSQSGAYNGKGHNGIDFGSPEGTPVVAALGGMVMGTGNTDLSHDSSGKQCYSYGKWVYVQHPNGLGTIYAHLSVISASKGQNVSTGSLLGYSGKTGYATGPHLHFSVYVASQVQIINLGDKQAAGQKTPCANATMPVAPTQAYLNPMKYL